MTSQDPQPERIDDHLTPDVEAGGTSQGSPVEGVEIDEAEVEQAVEPDDNAFEVDGPQVGHA